MSVLEEARNDMVAQLYSLAPGSDEILRQAQAIKTLSEADLNDRKLDFEIEKEETRKLEKSNECSYAELDRQIRFIEVVISGLNVIFNPGERLIGRIMNNKVKVKRDIMGYNFETTGVCSSNTFKNAQRDKYD